MGQAMVGLCPDWASGRIGCLDKIQQCSFHPDLALILYQQGYQEEELEDCFKEFYVHLCHGWSTNYYFQIMA